MNLTDNYPYNKSIEDAQVAADDWATAVYQDSGTENPGLFQLTWGETFEYAMENTTERPVYPTSPYPWENARHFGEESE